MSLLSPPQIPLFRITLFYGPETLQGASDTIHCVFNVKKRSWKGGVQVGIIVGGHQIQRLEEKLAFQAWITEHLQGVPSDEREDYLKRGYDLFVQFICFYKLGVYIQQGIQQKNTQVSCSFLISETDEAVQREAEKIKQQILIELDIEKLESDIESTSA